MSFLQTAMAVVQALCIVLLGLLACIRFSFRSIRHILGIAIESRSCAHDLTTALTTFTKSSYVVTQLDEVKQIASIMTELTQRTETEVMISAGIDVIKSGFRLVRSGKRAHNTLSKTRHDDENVRTPVDSIEEGVACLQFVQQIREHLTKDETALLKRLARQRNEELIVLFRAYAENDEDEFVSQVKDVMRTNAWSKLHSLSQ